MSTKYPFPSHVSVHSFVTVKLSDKNIYGLWKTQMLGLLESHDMLGFINADPVMQVCDHDYKLWNRSDTLVHGWILATLSEHTAVTVLDRLKSKLHQQTHFTAKHIWDQVQSMYGQQAERKKEIHEGRGGGGYCGSTSIDIKKKMKEEKERSMNKQALYDAVECRKLQEVKSVLKEGNVGITESISINDNTAIHIAVANSFPSDDRDGWFLKGMLDLNDIPLTQVRNSDGSTPLHLAVSLGNTNAAKILLDRNLDLLHAKDNQGCTPLDITLSRPWNKEMCLFFMTSEKLHIQLADTAVHEPLINAISYTHFDLAQAFIQRCNSLKNPVVLMAIAQNCPADFTPNQLIIYEMSRTPVLHFITRGTSDMKGCTKLVNLVLRAALAYPYKMLIWIGMKLKVFKDLKQSMKKLGDARDLLDTVCALIRFSNEPWSYRDIYKEAMLEAIRRDASDVVERIVYWFPEAALIVDEDGHNFAQAAWKNRASKVYALILDGNQAKHTSLSHESSKEYDHCGNNFLHFTARLGPAKKLDLISCPPFRMQRELQWFKDAQKIIPQCRTEKNCLGETPEMVFTKEHKDLKIESGDWMNKVANSIAITATLILTIMFASSIQVPGGTDDNGLPNLILQPTFILFEISISVSAAAASLSLLVFLVILTHPLSEDDFLLRLPLAMVIIWVNLFVSAAVGMLSYGAVLILLFGSNDPWILCVIAPIITLPIILFFLIYVLYLSHSLTDFMHSTFHFLIIYGFRGFKLVGRIFI